MATYAEELHAELTRAHRQNRKLRAQLAAAEGERDALRAIIEGRTTPPTPEEIDAHAAAGGVWTVGRDADRFGGADIAHPKLAREARNGRAGRWWPRDSTGRPCAWPTAEVSR